MLAGGSTVTTESGTSQDDSQPDTGDDTDDGSGIDDGGNPPECYDNIDNDGDGLVDDDDPDCDPNNPNFDETEG